MKHIPALDELRGLAVLLVMVYHFGFVKYPIFSALTGAGWIGVDLFFVLSGFLITSILLESKGSQSYFRNFYIRRTLRIFPLHYAYLIFLILALPHLLDPRWTAKAVEHQWWFWSYLSNILLVWKQDWSVAPGVYHFWSLAVEEQFYLIWPVVVSICSRRTLARVALSAMAIAPVLRLLSWHISHDATAAYVLTPCRMDALACGALLATGYRFGRRQLSLFACSFAVLFIWRGQWDHHDVVISVAGFSVATLMFGALVSRALTEASPSNSALRFLGKYSYGLYVWHPLVLRALMSYFVPQLPANEFLRQSAAFVIGIGLSIVCALCSWYLLEKRFNGLKDVLAPANSGPLTLAAPVPCDS